MSPNYHHVWAPVDKNFIHCDAYGDGLMGFHTILADIDSRLTAGAFDRFDLAGSSAEDPRR